MLVRATATLLLGLAIVPAGAADLRIGVPGAASAASGLVTETRAAPTPILALEPGTTEVLRTPRPARTVVIGDPRIVAATATNETTLLLTARATGLTNLILLDEDGNEFFRRIVQVGIPPRPIIVHRGEAVRSYLCDPICNLPPERTLQAAEPETPAGETAAAPAPPDSPAGSPAGSAASSPTPPRNTAPARP